ncbi:type II secretion system F family protein [Pantoea sp. BAV 3049]|uniref:type II secretion system F family protein n=1 Tax=Pantoea sp. BAV 3049 TaxID=2654188 RepID=UPI00131A96BC|nr:type II secretion system F family protein [Pantoea sp. BAV 3049]
MKMQLGMGLLIFAGLAVIVYCMLRQQRMKRLNGLINVIGLESGEKTVQQLKTHHEAELVLEKQNALLTWFRRLDGSHIYKLGLLILIFSAVLTANQLFQLELSRSTLMMAGMVALVAAIILPGKLRSTLVNRRVKKLSMEIPWLVDLLAVCVQCGMSLEVAFAFLSQKMAGINPDFTPFLARLVKRTEVSGLSDALKHFYNEVPSQENRMLCAMLVQSLQYGSSIYEQLVTLSREIREVQILTLEEKIGKLGAKMSVPLILFFMFPVVIIVAAPGVMRMMANA